MKCETCNGDGYVDIVDDLAEVIGPAPCPNCSPDDPLEVIDAALRATLDNATGHDAERGKASDTPCSRFGSADE